MHALHKPQTVDDLLPSAPARLRLAYDELLANQLALALVRRQIKHNRGRSLTGTGEKYRKIIEHLPFSPTSSQEFVIDEILHDLKSDQRMLRLLQGDVGSGKTLVAALVLAHAVEAGTQGAFMAPTEILAKQHLETLNEFFATSNIRCEVLTGRHKGKARTEILEALGNGEIDILIGTHALFQDGIIFKDLGLAIIDEQHRFGVHQRLALQDKASNRADVLVMTATPIPRTLSLTQYGDMEVSKITEKPAGRTPVDTRVLSIDKLDQVIEGLKRTLAGGTRAYWVCSLVEESDMLNLTSAEMRFNSLEKLFPGQVGLIHGRMKAEEKDAIMEQFQNGALKILVATTVIEVGVNVPEATIMIIENAERFGLAQLHQLRGRVGRGQDKSSCVLLYQGHLSETARARLNILRQTEDGFLIAEEDLRLRGSGELLGTRQSGLPVFRMADLSTHGELLMAARDDVNLILNQDPQLDSSRGEALRILLYLFGRDAAIRLLHSG